MNSREAFLENQINLFHDLIDELENTRINRRQREELKQIKVLYRQYICEYKELLIAQQVGSPINLTGV